MKETQTLEVKGRRASAEFNGAPEAIRSAFWRAIGAEARSAQAFGLWLEEIDTDEYAPETPSVRLLDRVAWGPSWRRRCLTEIRLRRWPENDLAGKIEALRELPAPAYFAQIAGLDVPENGGYVCCPAHDEQTPSCRVFPDERGWYCYACEHGGGVIELAAATWGMETRGDDFVELVKRLGEVFGA